MTHSILDFEANFTCVARAGSFAMIARGAMRSVTRDQTATHDVFRRQTERTGMIRVDHDGCCQNPPGSYKRRLLFGAQLISMAIRYRLIPNTWSQIGTQLVPMKSSTRFRHLGAVPSRRITVDQRRVESSRCGGHLLSQ